MRRRKTIIVKEVVVDDVCPHCGSALRITCPKKLTPRNDEISCPICGCIFNMLEKEGRRVRYFDHKKSKKALEKMEEEERK